MKLLVMLILASVALLFLGRKGRSRVEGGDGETAIAIRKIREERKSRHGS